MTNFSTTAATKTLVVGTEFSVAQNANFNSSSPKTTSGYVTVWLDLTAVAAGDTVQIRVYRAIAGGTLTPDDPANATPGTIWTRNIGLVGGNWDITVKQTAGTGRTIGFEVNQDTNDVNAASISAGAIGANQLASNAITSAKFATDAIDSNALAASAVTEMQSGLATSSAVANVQADTTSILSRVDVATSTRAPSSTALSTAQWTNTRAGLVDNLDTAVSSRAPASTAVSNVDYTSTRAAKIDQLDASVSSRAAATDYTSTRAAKLDNLDTSVSSRSSASAVASVQTDTDDIQSRLPTALDGDGNMKAGVQSLVSGAIDSITAAIFGFVEESGAPAGARTFLQRLRIKWSILAAKGRGLTITTAGTEHLRDGADTKDRATFTLGTDGTRTPGTFDGD